MKRFVSLMLAAALMLGLGGGCLAIEPKYEVSESYEGSVYHQRLLELQASGSAVTDLLNIAISQLGYHEGEEGDRSGADPLGNGNYTEYGYAFPFDGAEWCAMFIAWCAQQAGIPRRVIGHSSLADPYYFHLASYSAKTYAPKRGDLVYFGTAAKYNHVALVLEVTPERIYTVEGNANDAVRLGSYSRANAYIKEYSPWTSAACTLDALGITRLVTLSFSPNGGEGRMETVCCSNLMPIGLYVNQIEVSDYTGEPLYSHYIYREGLEFAGWYVQRDADGAWLTETGFLSPQELISTGKPRAVIADGAEMTPDGSWSQETLPCFTLHAVWRDDTGGTDYDKEAYLPRTDATGWYNEYWDLKPRDWYYAAARYCVKNGLLEGTEAGTFSPDGTLTRAQTATILHRLAGTPAASLESGYEDVPRGTWYTAAVDWATENGVVEGTDKGVFAPNAPVTKHQLLAMLCRYSGGESSGTGSEETPNWAAGAVAWASSRGLTSPEIDAIDGDQPLSRSACAYIIAKLKGGA